MRRYQCFALPHDFLSPILEPTCPQYNPEKLLFAEELAFVHFLERGYVLHLSWIGIYYHFVTGNISQLLYPFLSIYSV